MEHKLKEDLRVVDFPVAEPSPVTKHLEATKKLLEKGWCQGNYKIKDSFCIIGAILYAGPRLPPSVPCSLLDSYKAIESIIGPECSIGTWNDHPARTKAEVLTLMDVAIATSIIGS